MRWLLEPRVSVLDPSRTVEEPLVSENSSRSSGCSYTLAVLLSLFIGGGVTILRSPMLCILGGTKVELAPQGEIGPWTHAWEVRHIIARGPAINLGLQPPMIASARRGARPVLAWLRTSCARFLAGRAPKLVHLGMRSVYGRSSSGVQAGISIDDDPLVKWTAAIAGRANANANASVNVASPEQMKKATFEWLHKMVIGMNLCPFAQGSLPGTRIISSTASTLDDLLEEVEVELYHLARADSSTPATTLVILPWWMHNTTFQEYMEGPVLASMAMALDIDECIQILPFHHGYEPFDGQYRGEGPPEGIEDAAHFTHRSPYPMLHLLRQVDIDNAKHDHGEIPLRNAWTLRDVGVDKLRQELDAIRQYGATPSPT